MGHAVQPGADRLALADRAGLAEQDQERRLERVVGLVRVAQDAPADAEHHRAVPLDQQGEGRLHLGVPSRPAPRRAAIRSSNWPSDRPASVPALKIVCRSRRHDEFVGMVTTRLAFPGLASSGPL